MSPRYSESPLEERLHTMRGQDIQSLESYSREWCRRERAGRFASIVSGILLMAGIGAGVVTFGKEIAEMQKSPETERLKGSVSHGTAKVLETRKSG